MRRTFGVCDFRCYTILQRLKTSCCLFCKLEEKGQSPQTTSLMAGVFDGAVFKQMHDERGASKRTHPVSRKSAVSDSESAPALITSNGTHQVGQCLSVSSWCLGLRFFLALHTRRRTPSSRIKQTNSLRESSSTRSLPVLQTKQKSPRFMDALSAIVLDDVRQGAWWRVVQHDWCCASIAGYDSKSAQRWCHCSYCDSSACTGR